MSIGVGRSRIFTLGSSPAGVFSRIFLQDRFAFGIIRSGSTGQDHLQFRIVWFDQVIGGQDSERIFEAVEARNLQ